MNVTLHEIANLVNGLLVGDGKIQISSLSPIEDITPGSLVFAEGIENLQRAECSEAAAILVHERIEHSTKPLIRVSTPFKAFIQLIHHFYSPEAEVAEIHPTAIIAETASLGKNVSIGPYVVIESHSSIGDNCVIKSHVHIGSKVQIGPETKLYPQVTIYNQCKIGARVCIHASSVIGSDGFGYKQIDGAHVKIPHVGHVVIGDDVEIGANTVIDRGTLGTTVIGSGTKIDNLVQIAHSVKLGEHNIVCAFTGIAGSTTSGNHVIFAANVGVSDHVKIDNHVVLGARTGVPPKKHLREGNIYLGNPARPRDKAIEQELSLTRIPFMRNKLTDLNQRVNQLYELISEKED